MRPRFCPRCGKKNIKEDLCPACLQRQHPLAALPEAPLQLQLCTYCRKYLRKNGWLRFKGLREPIRVLVERVLAKHQKQGFLGQYRIIIPEHDLFHLKQKYATPKPGLRFELTVAVKTPELPLPRLVPVSILFSSCPACSKRGTRYFEGILQVRHASEEIYSFIRKQFGKNYAALISDEHQVQNGVDFYLTSQALLRKIGVLLHKKFGGILKMSARIFTLNKQTSKDVYRVTAYFKPLPLKEGDVFIHEDSLMKLLRRGKQVVYFDFERAASVSTKSGTLMHVEKKPGVSATVIKTRPVGEIMDPETYQPVVVSNQHVIAKMPVGKKVQIATHHGKTWIV